MPSLTSEEIARRKSYIQLTPDDESLLREIHPLLAGQSGLIINRFYEFLLSQEHTRRMLAAPGLVERLKGLQRTYFEQLTAGDYGEEYFRNRFNVGEVHERVGLSPEWYIGAYHKYLEIVSEVLRSVFVPGDERYFRTVSSLTKLVMLDMTLAIDAYIERAQKRLAERNEELLRLQGAKQTLTDMIVHDLQNPLAGIRAFLEYLAPRDGGLEAGERVALQEALRRCDDLGQMIMNVLQVSRAEAGALETNIENLDLADLAKSSIAAFALHAEQQGRSIVLDAPAPVPFRSDQSLLRRVLYNLIQNAVRHTPRGTRIVVRVAAFDGNRARISVSDDGQGIPKHAQPLLFERFGGQALRSAGLRVDTGLGLAFCKSAIDALGGRISVESEGERGTAFLVELRPPT